MNLHINESTQVLNDQSGLLGLCGIAAFYHVPADPAHIKRELGLPEGSLVANDIIRAAQFIGFRARLIRGISAERLKSLPTPTLVRNVDGAYYVLGGRTPNGLYRVIDPVSRIDQELTLEVLAEDYAAEIILIQRKIGGPGHDPVRFGLAWIWPSIIRYRTPLIHVLVASLALQIFALITPLFFQVVIDKVLVHHAQSTLVVMMVGLIAVGLFEVILQFLRTYALSHTSNRIDVELG